MQTHRPVSLVLLAGLAGACSSSSVPGWTPLNGPALRVSRPHTLGVVVEDPSDFHVVTQRSVASAKAAGDYGGVLREPSPRVAKKLAAILTKKYHLELLGIRTAYDAASLSPSDLTLDVATIDWAIACPQEADAYSKDPPVCQIIYRVRVKLTDSRDGQILAVGDCQSVPTQPLLVSAEDPGMKINTPHVEAALRDAADNCVDRLRRELFGIYGESP